MSLRTYRSSVQTAPLQKQRMSLKLHLGLIRLWKQDSSELASSTRRAGERLPLAALQQMKMRTRKNRWLKNRYKTSLLPTARQAGLRSPRSQSAFLMTLMKAMVDWSYAWLNDSHIWHEETCKTSKYRNSINEELCFLLIRNQKMNDGTSLLSIYFAQLDFKMSLSYLFCNLTLHI